MKTFVLVVLVLGILFLSDYFMDFPAFLHLPEIWHCAGETNGFQFC